MKYLIALLALALSGCAGFGGMLPDSAVNAVANAGGGCVKAAGIWGSAILIIGSADKGVIRNGELTVAGECGGITIKDAASVRSGALPPGSVTTITVPSSTTTTVTPLRP